MSDLEIYDIVCDEMRPATQEDLDRLNLATQAMALFRRGVAALDRRCTDAILGDMPFQKFVDLVRMIEQSPDRPGGLVPPESASPSLRKADRHGDAS